MEWLKDEILFPWLWENVDDNFSAYCFCKKIFHSVIYGKTIIVYACSSKHTKIVSTERTYYGMCVFLNAEPQAPIVQNLVTGQFNLNNTQISLSDYSSIVLTPDVPETPILGEKNISKFFERDDTTKVEIL